MGLEGVFLLVFFFFSCYLAVLLLWKLLMRAGALMCGKEMSVPIIYLCFDDCCDVCMNLNIMEAGALKHMEKSFICTLTVACVELVNCMIWLCVARQGGRF